MLKLKQFKIILTRIDNDIYSIVDACPNAMEMWKAIERMKQGESINVQNLETNLLWEFRKFTSQDGETLESYYSSNNLRTSSNTRNKNVDNTSRSDIRTRDDTNDEPEDQEFEAHYLYMEKIQKVLPDTANNFGPIFDIKPLAKSQELKTVSYHKLYDILKQHQHEVNEIRVERLGHTANPLELIAQQQPVYHPQNHPTHYTQNSSTRSQQAATRNRGKAIVNSPPLIYDQEPSMVVEDDEMSKDKEIDKLVALISLSFKKINKPTNNNLRTSSNTSTTNQDNSPRINRGTGYDNQRIGNVSGAKETVEQADWKDDIDDEPEDQELEAHSMYMAQIQEVTPDVADNSGPIFDSEPLQNVSNEDNYNVFAIKSEHPEQSKFVNDTYPIKQDEHNVIIDSLDMSYDREQID
uniref:Uncharacterized protein n=1 Tax=Tanacetum cinerariifolium TaxID=118510 RepID=A0A6L2M455_TANCI|nr:hypothetical protein [Tanacetum cinerariifolium]